MIVNADPPQVQFGTLNGGDPFKGGDNLYYIKSDGKASRLTDGVVNAGISDTTMVTPRPDLQVCSVP